MITNVELTRFRGFERLRADLSPHAYIVGPNSAGKSTVLEAVALAERSLKRARRKTPPMRVMHRGGLWKAYPLDRMTEEGEDPVRFDFGCEEACVSIHWCGDAIIHLVWPETTGDDLEVGFFYLEVKEGGQPRSQEAMRSAFPPVVVVPVVTPLDRIEELKDMRYVRSQATTRRASRHFRNHALLMDQAGEWDQFKEFCRAWLPELDLLDVSFDAGLNRLSVYYSEPGSRIPKELAWAGDGFQIWVQLLWHLYRAEGASTVVLDEPEVYLHPDLQRRLVRLLDTLGSQIILASHSADVISEAPDGGVLWVDRRQRIARRATSQHTLSALSASLGNSYNLALARSMRARLVLVCDAEDTRVIRALARQVGAINLPDEQAVSVVPLREPSNWSDRHDLGEVLREVLPQGIPASLLLGGGLRHPQLNHELVQSLAESEVDCHVCELPELESYLMDTATIARVSGAAPEAVALHMADAHISLYDSARAAWAAQWVSSGSHGESRSVLAEAEAAFDDIWATPEKRGRIVRASWVLDELNKWLERDGYRPAIPYAIARAIKAPAIPVELITVLLDLDDRAAPAPW